MAGLGDFAEKLLGSWVAVETVRNSGGGVGNSGSDYQNVHTGTDSDGTTLISGRLVSGVSNQALFAGVAVLLGLSVMAWVIVKD